MNIITTTAELAGLCDQLHKSDYVTFDTEFMREHTFWPELCLVQLASDDHEALIDPLADGISLEPLFDLMRDETVLKVVHSGRQDLEIFYNLGKLVPAPIFDTQIAAMVCGFGESVSYANLVQRYCSQSIDKSSQYTDWRRRPLKDKQLTYALGDVTHLRVIYKALEAELEKTGRAHWLKEEMNILSDPATYEQKPDHAWKRLKMRVRTPRAVAIMMEVAAWRERTAQSNNVPRNRVMKDDGIYEIANQSPKSKQELGELRSVSKGLANSQKGETLLAAIRAGQERDLNGVPQPKRGKQPSGEVLAVADLLKVLLKAISAKNGVAPKLIASADDLEKIALNDSADVPALAGWRREMFGEQALAVKRGEAALKLVDGHVQAVKG